MIEIKEMKQYALKPGDIVKYDNAKYMVWAPIDDNGTVQLYRFNSRPVDVINVPVNKVELNNTKKLRKSLKSLREIIEELGNKSYSYIEMRCKWTDHDGDHDEFWGCCYYDNTLNKLFPLDGDSYSLNDLYDEWKEYDTDLFENPCLTVWEYGRVED